MHVQQSDESDLTPIRTDLCGAIDEDIYCLICGYNLRGLTGDPVRCPECGSFNDLGTAAIPAALISLAMRNMETAPTMCAGCAFALLVFASPFLLMAYEVFFCAYVIAAPCFFSWFLFYFRMKRVYENRAGWRRILRDFHVATFFCAAGVPLLWLTMALATRNRNPTTGYWSLGSLVVTAVLFVLGLRVYRAAQRRIAAMQRDAAVRMARDFLRRRNTFEYSVQARE